MAFLAPLVGAVGGAVGGGSGILGSLVSGAGTLFSAFSGMQSANYQAKVAEANAEQANNNAKLAMASGQVKAEDNDAETRALLGQQEAIQGASGLSINSGSSVLTRRAARRLGRRDTLNIINDATTEMRNFQNEAASEKASAGMAKRSGMSSLLGGFLSAGASLVGNASSVSNPSRYDSWGPTLRKRGAVV